MKIMLRRDIPSRGRIPFGSLFEGLFFRNMDGYIYFVRKDPFGVLACFAVLEDGGISETYSAKIGDPIVWGMIDLIDLADFHEEFVKEGWPIWAPEELVIGY